MLYPIDVTSRSESDQYNEYLFSAVGTDGLVL